MKVKVSYSNQIKEIMLSRFTSTLHPTTQPVNYNPSPYYTTCQLQPFTLLHNLLTTTLHPTTQPVNYNPTILSPNLWHLWKYL